MIIRRRPTREARMQCREATAPKTCGETKFNLKNHLALVLVEANQPEKTVIDRSYEGRRRLVQTVFNPVWLKTNNKRCFSQNPPNTKNLTPMSPIQYEKVAKEQKYNWPTRQSHWCHCLQSLGLWNKTCLTIKINSKINCTIRVYCVLLTELQGLGRRHHQHRRRRHQQRHCHLHLHCHHHHHLKITVRGTIIARTSEPGTANPYKTSQGRKVRGRLRYS